MIHGASNQQKKLQKLYLLAWPWKVRKSLFCFRSLSHAFVYNAVDKIVTRSLG